MQFCYNTELLLNSYMGHDRLNLMRYYHLQGCRIPFLAVYLYVRYSSLYNLPETINNLAIQMSNSFFRMEPLFIWKLLQLREKYLRPSRKAGYF